MAHMGLVATAQRFPEHADLDDIIAMTNKIMALDDAIYKVGQPVTVVTRTDHIEIQEAR